MGRSFWLACLLAWATEQQAQPSLFSPLQQGVRGPVYCFLEDSVSSSFYIGGGLIGAYDMPLSPGIVRWDGAEFHNVGCGFEYDCLDTNTSQVLATPVRALEHWQGALYAAGDFQQSVGVSVNFIARWDGVDSLWKPLQNGLSGPVYSLRSYPDGLYAAGWFEYANDTLEVNGLARWDGSTWHKVHDLPKLDPNDINRINDLAFYQGDLYIGGEFGGTNGRLDIAKWDGTAWVDVDGGFLGVFSTVNKLEVHDGLLYVMGSFANYPPYGHPNNPGSGIVTWDGSIWNDLGGGTAGSSNASVYSNVWIRDTLYVSGRFTTIGGVPTGRIARWDGHRGCSLVPPDYFYPDIGPIGVFRDTLVVGGSFTVAGPDSINRVAKWVAGSYVDSCQVFVGVGPEHEDAQEPSGLSLHPNPAEEVVTVSRGGRPLPGVPYVVHDALGRLVGSGRTDVVSTLDVRYLVPGAYAVTVLNSQGAVFGQGRMIKH